jgi:pimeloyl-ACP methyl ester carboxylesterase
MKPHPSRYVLIIVCLAIAVGLASCCARDTGKKEDADSNGKADLTRTAPGGTTGLVEHETTITSGDLELKAVVTIPPHKPGELVPGVVIVHTFDPHDCDGMFVDQGSMFRPYRDLARELAGHGIASIRFDKRTWITYVPKLSIRKLTIADFYPDALAALERLRTTEGVDPGRLFFIGHGEGGVTVPAIVEANPDLGVRGLVLIAPPLMPYDILIIRRHQHAIYQIELAIRHDPALEKTEGPRRDQLRDAVNSYIRVFNLLHEEGKSWPEGLSVNGFFEPYWRQANTVYEDNLDRIERLTLPILIVQGNLDNLVLTEDLLRVARETEATGHITIAIEDGLGHNLIDPATRQVSAAAASTIANWILNPPEPTPPENVTPPDDQPAGGETEPPADQGD